MIHEQWMDKAYCGRDPNPDAWFPTNPESLEARRARLGCLLLCPVLRQCAAAALRADFPLSGIWAGVIFHRPQMHSRTSQNEARSKLYLIAKGTNPPVHIKHPH